MQERSEFAEVCQVFEAIYQRGAWGKGSGGGSKLELTRGYIAFLSAALETLDVNSIVDVGCGDWQFSQHIDWGARNYLGIDVDSSLIESHKSTFGKKNIRFLKADVFSELPFGDLLICKDVLQHWPNEMILQFEAILPNFRYALITNCMEPAEKRNMPVALGRFRPLDISAPPFSFPVVPVFDFKGPTWHKVVMLWNRDTARLSSRARAVRMLAQADLPTSSQPGSRASAVVAAA